jgi:hypothetical protein
LLNYYYQKILKKQNKKYLIIFTINFKIYLRISLILN